jgi:hypothetical protein
MAEPRPKKKAYRPGNRNRRPTKWQKSKVFADMGAANLKWFHAHRHEFPRCTATARTTGKRCRQLAVEGRTVCRWHGGLTPRGKEHGQRQLRPKPPSKQSIGDWQAAEQKLRKWERQDRDRVRRLKAMTDEQFWRYLARMRSRLGDPLSPIFNAAIADEKRRRGPDPRLAKGATPEPQPKVDPELVAIEERIAVLRGELAGRRPLQGVFE